MVGASMAQSLAAHTASGAPCRCPKGWPGRQVIDDEPPRGTVGALRGHMVRQQSLPMATLLASSRQHTWSRCCSASTSSRSTWRCPNRPNYPRVTRGSDCRCGCRTRVGTRNTADNAGQSDRCCGRCATRPVSTVDHGGRRRDGRTAGIALDAPRSVGWTPPRAVDLLDITVAMAGAIAPSPRARTRREATR